MITRALAAGSSVRGTDSRKAAGEFSSSGRHRGSLSKRPRPRRPNAYDQRKLLFVQMTGRRTNTPFRFVIGTKRANVARGEVLAR